MYTNILKTTMWYLSVPQLCKFLGLLHEQYSPLLPFCESIIHRKRYPATPYSRSNLNFHPHYGKRVLHTKYLYLMTEVYMFEAMTNSALDRERCLVVLPFTCQSWRVFPLMD